MLEEEFEKIWKAQTAFNDSLTDPIKEEIYKAIFDQRPLKSQSHLIGRCLLEPMRKCAPDALPVAQRFRLLQKANDLEIIPPYISNENPRRLTLEERNNLLNELDRVDKLTFSRIRQLMGLDKIARKLMKEAGEKKLESFHYRFTSRSVEKNS